MHNCIGNRLSVQVLYVGFVMLSSAEILLSNLFSGSSNSVTGRDVDVWMVSIFFRIPN